MSHENHPKPELVDPYELPIDHDDMRRSIADERPHRTASDRLATQRDDGRSDVRR